MIYCFNSCSLDTDRLELWLGKQPVAVEPQVFRLLLLLIENRNRVVSKDELFEQVWEGRIVSDATLNSRINAARRAVGDNGKTQAVIRTVARRGFRFVAEVVEPAARAEATESDTPPDMSAGRAEPFQLSLPDKPSIVVLPFENRSDDPGQEYFSDGITEDLTTALSRFRWLFVIARSTAYAFRGQLGDARRIGRELGVRYLLCGSVRKAANRVRLSAQLVDAVSSGNVWGGRFEESLEDVFALQDMLTESIVGAIEPELGRAEQRRARLKKPEHVGAWDVYQQGMWHLYRRTRADLVEAHRLFERALLLDPGLVPALTGSVNADYYQVVLGHADDPERHRNHALVMARQAVELDGDDAAAHNAVGQARIMRREHEQAIPALELALQLNPNLAWAHYGLGAATVFSGRHGREAIRHIERAIRLSPRDAHMGSFMVRMADAWLAVEDYEQSVEWARKALREPGFQWSRFTVLAASLGHLGRVGEAREVLGELASTRPDVSIAFVRRNHLYTENATFVRYLEGLEKANFT